MKKIQVSKTGEVSCVYIKTTNHKSTKKNKEQKLDLKTISKNPSVK